jgi:hypothetical protein
MVYGVSVYAVLVRDDVATLEVVVKARYVERRRRDVSARPPIQARSVEDVVELVDRIQVQKVTGSKSEQVRQCMDLQLCLHTGYTWSPLTV